MRTKIFIPSGSANFGKIVAVFENMENVIVSNAVRVDGSDEVQKGVVIEANAWDLISSKELFDGVPVTVNFTEKIEGFGIGKYASQSFDVTITPEEIIEVVPKYINEAIRRIDGHKNCYSVVIDVNPDIPNRFSVSAHSYGHPNHDYWQQELGTALRKAGFPLAFRHVWIK